MKLSVRALAAAGVAIAAPAFVFNYVAHGFELPGPDDVDRLDGVFSLMFMTGVALIVTALIACSPSPLGRKGRHLLYVEAAMVALAGMWSVAIIADPGLSDSSNPLLIIGDGAWPIHQAFMLIVGIAGLRARRWPSPERYALFGPFFSVVCLMAAWTAGADLLAAVFLSAGWASVGVGILSLTRERALTVRRRRVLASS
jgi:hypothetical protein